jgi:FkbM family methyltransferase
MSVQNPDDQPFQHYTTKHRVVARISQSLFDNVTYTVRHGLLKGMKRKGGLGWLPEFVAAGSTKTPEQDFWFNQDFKGLVVYDIGAFHGLLTLYFARKSRRVISYEPNTRNHARLVDNIKLNGVTNVLVRPVGLGSEHRLATMVSSPLMPGGASMEAHAAAGVLNSSMSRARKSPSWRARAKHCSGTSRNCF